MLFRVLRSRAARSVSLHAVEKLTLQLANICKISRSRERKRQKRIVTIPPSEGTVVTEEDEMGIVMMDESPGDGTNSARARHRPPDAMSTGETLTAAERGAATTHSTGNARDHPAPIDDSQKTIGAEAQVRRTDVIVRSLITSTFLVASAVTCLTYRFSLCRMSTRNLLIGCSVPSTTVA